jgi:hypothetical protein
MKTTDPGQHAASGVGTAEKKKPTISSSFDIAYSFLAEFEKELETTRKFLERVPENRLQWRPHEKSMTAGQLALHIALAPGRPASDLKLRPHASGTSLTAA